MNILTLLTTGFAGSTALTGLHQALIHKDGTPRVDLLGKQAIEKFLGGKKSDLSESTLYWSSIAGDILSNSAFYSIIAKAKNPVFTGTIVGAVIGTTTLFSPNFFGLNKNLVKSSNSKSALTLGYYIFGGLVAGIVANYLKKRSN